MYRFLFESFGRFFQQLFAFLINSRQRCVPNHRYHIKIRRLTHQLRDLSLLEQRCPLGKGACLYAVSERSEEHTSELQSRFDLVCSLLLEKIKGILVI